MRGGRAAGRCGSSSDGGSEPCEAAQAASIAGVATAPVRRAAATPPPRPRRAWRERSARVPGRAETDLAGSQLEEVVDRAARVPERRGGDRQRKNPKIGKRYRGRSTRGRRTARTRASPARPLVGDRVVAPGAAEPERVPRVEHLEPVLREPRPNRRRRRAVAGGSGRQQPANSTPACEMPLQSPSPGDGEAAVRGARCRRGRQHPAAIDSGSANSRRGCPREVGGEQAAVAAIDTHHRPERRRARSPRTAERHRGRELGGTASPRAPRRASAPNRGAT